MELNKSIVLSIRLKPYHLAKALDGIKQYDKSFIPSGPADILKNTFMHGINYLCHALPLEPTSESINELSLLTRQGKKRKKIDPEKILERPLKLDANKFNGKLSQEIKTKSKKSIVTNFDPSELIEEEGE